MLDARLPHSIQPRKCKTEFRAKGLRTIPVVVSFPESLTRSADVSGDQKYGRHSVPGGRVLEPEFSQHNFLKHP